MINPDDILIGIEILYGVGGLASAMALALWRLFSKYSKLEHEIEYLKRDSGRDDQRFSELLRKIDAIQEELAKMRLEMKDAHSEISERVVKIEAVK